MDLDFLEHVPVFCYVVRRVGEDFVLVYLNEAARNRTPGLAAFLGRPLTELYSDQPVARAAALRCVEQQETVEEDILFRKHDRTEATEWLRLRYVPSPPDLVLIYVLPLNRPEMAQAALSESEARYQSLVASLPDAVMLRGVDGRVLFCNEVALALFGAASYADILGKSDPLAPELMVRDEAGQPIDVTDVPSLRVMKTGQPERGPVYSFAKGDELRWMRVAAQPIRSTDGRITGSVTTFTDVTERVVAQTALRESAARLELALASARMGVWEYEPAADSGWWSANLPQIFQLNLVSGGVAVFLERICSDDRSTFAEKLARCSAGSQGDSFQDEFRIVGDDGVTRWARVFASLSITASRRVLAGTLMDITEQRLLEERLHLASRLESIGRLAGGIAHDFNNLLAAMFGSLDLIEDHVSGQVREDFDTIRHSAERARDLTRQLLAFARKQPVSLSAVDLVSLVRDVLLLLQRLVGPRVAISIVTEGQPLVSADKRLLEQVLVNLVVNARDAMPDGGHLEIRVDVVPGDSVSAPDGRARLTVSDSGIGMDEATRKRIFEPFFTTKSQGTGLGLASSYGIIQQLRGDIRVESEPSGGTRFIVTLPCIVAAADVQGEQGHVPQEPVSRQLGTVLVVDDENAVRMTTARIVRSFGYEVLDADGGAQARVRSAAYPGRIDTLLCDIAMPGEDGRELAVDLVASRPGLKVVFMSGYSSDMQDLRVEGALFLQKPFSREELASKLRTVAGRV